MGSIRLEMSGGVVGSTKGRTYTVSDENINRLVDWAQAHFGTNGQELTVQAALVAWAQHLIDVTREAIIRHEREVIMLENEPAPFEAE